MFSHSSLLTVWILFCYQCEKNENFFIKESVIAAGNSVPRRRPGDRVEEATRNSGALALAFLPPPALGF